MVSVTWSACTFLVIKPYIPVTCIIQLTIQAPNLYTHKNLHTHTHTPLQVNQLIVTNFSVTQRIPTNQPLACHCFSSPYAPVRFSSRVFSYSHQCIDGYTVELNSLLWAGLIPTATSGSNPSLYPPNAVACPRIPPNATAVESDFTSFVHESRQRAEIAQGNSSGNFDPVDVIPYVNGLNPGGGAPVYCFNSTNVSELVDFERQGEFSIEVCSRGYCRGDLRDSWFVANVEFPCVENRQGPLCGQCKPGFAVTLYSTVRPLVTGTSLICTTHVVCNVGNLTWDWE